VKEAERRLNGPYSIYRGIFSDIRSVSRPVRRKGKD
jgi:hypothetical protein